MIRVISTFPPSFSDGPVGYAVALFGDALASGLSLMVLLHFIFEPRRRREMEQLVNGTPNARKPSGYRTQLGAWNRIMIGWMLFVFLRTTPDAIWMFMWGEASDRTMRFLFTVDYYLDGLALVPLFLAVLMWGWSRRAISQQLQQADDYPLAMKILPAFVPVLKLIAVTAVLAVGVTAGKVL